MHATLNSSTVKRIRKLWPESTQRVIAKKFGVRQGTISKIISRTLWAHVK